MTDPAFIRNSLLCLLTITGFAAVTSASAPNIVVFFSDDHAQQAIGAYQDRISAAPQSLLFKNWAPMKTPNIDRLADQGVLFTHSYVSTSICGPSRAALLTGLHSHAHGQTGNTATAGNFDGSQQTVPKLLQTAGYHTALIGKWHLGSEPTGFDHYERLVNQGAYYSPLLRTTQPNGSLLNVNYPGEYVADVITGRTLAWLQARIDASRADPFFLLVNHKGAHRNWEPAPEETDAAVFRAVEWDFTVTPNPDSHPGEPELWTPAASPRPANFGDYLDNYPSRTDASRMHRLEIAAEIRLDSDLKLEGTTFGGIAYDEVRAWWAANSPGMTAEEKEQHYQRRYINDYALTAQSVDRSVGDILNFLEANNLDRNTIILYSSDQGFFLGEHGWFDKRLIYEESLWTPLLMQWKDASGASLLAAGTEVTEPVQVIDYGPTLLQAAGITGYTPMHGESFLGLATAATGDEPATWRDAIYYHYPAYEGGTAVVQHYGMRNERYKLIYHYQNSQWELFDLQSDPTEMNNLFYGPASGNFDDPTDGIEGPSEFQDLVRDLMLELRGLRELYQDEIGPDFVIPGIDGPDFGLLLNLTANIAEYEGGRTPANSPKVTEPVPGSGLAFHINFTPEASDLSGTVLLIEIGGTANGSGLYLVNGVPTFIMKQNSDNPATPLSLADTQLNEIAVQSTIALLAAGTPYRAAAIYIPPTLGDIGALRLAVQPAGGNITIDSFEMTSAGNRFNWSGNETLSIGTPDSISSSAGGLASTAGFFDRSAVKALVGSIERGLFWNSSGIAVSNLSTTGITRNGNGFDIGIKSLIKGATYRLYRDSSLPLDDNKVEIDSVVAGDGSETLSDQSLPVPLSGSYFYQVFEER